MVFTLRSFIQKVFIVFITSTFISPLLQAQEVTQDTLKIKLDEISVEATYSTITIGEAPLSVSYMIRDATDITARPGATLDELTFSLPGIWINNRENHALGERMTVRGMGWRSPFGVRGIQVVLDDIPLTVADGQTIMNMVDPSMVQSLELLRGPSATYWGNSSGGVLYMKTRPPADAPNLTLRSYAGSFSTMKHEARWNDRIGGVRLNAYGSYYESDGFRDHSASELIRAGFSAGYDITERSNIEARVAYAGMPNAQHPGSLPQDDAKNEPTKAWPPFVDSRAGKDFQQLMVSSSYIHDLQSGLLTVSAHSTLRELNNPLLPSVGFISVDRLAGGTRAAYDFGNLPFHLQFGGELKWQRDSRGQFDNINGSPGNNVMIDQTDFVSNQALFAKAVVDAQPFSISFGLRGDRMVFSVDDFIANEESSRTFTTLNPSIGVNYSRNNTRLFANFSTSFESPTTTEFKNRPGGGTGFNPDLHPEKTIGLETGLRGIYQPLNAEYDITIFGLRVTDLIIPFEEEDGGPTLFRNEGNTRHHGIESHFRIQPNQRFTLDVMYTWINAEFGDGDFEGNEIPGVTPHRIGSALSVNVGNHTISSDVKWVGEYFADSENTATNDSYFLLNGRWLYRGFSFENWRIQPFFSVDNILNQRYNTSVSINAFGGRYYEPGSDRSFTAGLQIEFL